MTHGDLVRRGASYLRRRGFPIVATELVTHAAIEQPDVIGYRSNCSALVEVKVSRADFLRDARKPHRGCARAGLGVYRFYLAPKGLIRTAEVPAGWGLLEATGRTIVQAVGPPLRSNLWPGYTSSSMLEERFPEWCAFRNAVNIEQELGVLYSIVRRLSETLSIEAPRPAATIAEAAARC